MPRSLCPCSLTGYYELVRKQEITVEPKYELTEEKPSSFCISSRASNVATWFASPITIRTVIVAVPAFSTKCSPAFKLLKLRDIAIDFDDIQDIELRGRA